MAATRASRTNSLVSEAIPLVATSFSGFSVSPSMITNCGGQYVPEIAYLSSHPLNLEVSTERASTPVLISATTAGTFIHKSIRLILASRPVT